MQNRMSRVRTFFMTILAMVAFTTVQAQDAEISDVDLEKYAVVMDSIDAMKATIQKEYNALIQGEELMAGGRRFVEIQAAVKDSVKLAEIEVTEEEMMVYDNIQAKYEEMTAEFKESYTALIKDDLGGALYNEITKALRSDAEVKARYEAILAEVKKRSGDAEIEAGLEG